jgi:hypothetical protein
MNGETVTKDVLVDLGVIKLTPDHLVGAVFGAVVLKLLGS